MKKCNYIWLFVFVLFLHSGTLFAQKKLPQRENGLLINGSIDRSMDGQKISIDISYPYRYMFPKLNAQRTAIIHDGQFVFDINVPLGLEPYYITLDNKGKKSSALFYLEAKATQIMFLDTLLKKSTVRGNDSHLAYVSFIKERKESKLDYVDFTKDWLKKNSKSPLATRFLSSLVKQISDDELASIFKSIPSQFKTNIASREISYFLDHLVLGREALNFTQADTSGNGSKGKVRSCRFLGIMVYTMQGRTPIA